VSAGRHPVSAGSLIALPPVFWLGIFFVVPFLFVLMISLATPQIGRPPYVLGFSLDSYVAIFGDAKYLDALLNSLRLAALTTLLTLILGFPMAYVMARAAPGPRAVMLLLVFIPFWTASLLRIYAWMALLQEGGIVNRVLIMLGVIDQPLTLLYTTGSILVGMVYAYLPFMVLPLFAVLSRLDWRLLDAASDLGARPPVSFFRITLPLAAPGILAGSLLVFVPALGEFVVPELLGGQSGLMIGKLIWYEFFNSNDWPRAAALSVSFVVVILSLPLLGRLKGRRPEAGA
jgi:putrescine transport system permease protein